NNDSPLAHDALRQVLHQIPNDLAGIVRAQPLGQSRETAEVADQDSHFQAAALQEVGVALQLADQLGGEELFELDARADGDGAGEIAADRPRQQLHDLSLQRPYADTAADGAIAGAIQDA